LDQSVELARNDRGLAWPGWKQATPEIRQPQGALVTVN
jgi:hypothetical protein